MTERICPTCGQVIPERTPRAARPGTGLQRVADVLAAAGEPLTARQVSEAASLPYGTTRARSWPGVQSRPWPVRGRGPASIRDLTAVRGPVRKYRP